MASPNLWRKLLPIIGSNGRVHHAVGVLTNLVQNGASTPQELIAALRKYYEDGGLDLTPPVQGEVRERAVALIEILRDYPDEASSLASAISRYGARLHSHIPRVTKNYPIY